MTTETQNTQQADKPVYKIRIGSITASIWQNVSENGTIHYNTDLVRNYTDKDGNWQKTSSFPHDQLLNLAMVSRRAEAKIAELLQA